MTAWFIARRYLVSRFVTAAAFLLISLSVAILIILLAVMEGFKTDMVERIRGTNSDIKVGSRRTIGLDESRLAVEKLVRGVSGVRATVPYVETMAMYSLSVFGGGRPRTGHLGLHVLDLRAEAQVGKLDEYVANYADTAGLAVPRSVEETLSRQWLEAGIWKMRHVDPPAYATVLRPVILGVQTFPNRYFGNLVGYPLELKTISPVTALPRTARFVIAGYFRSRDVHHDSHTILLDLEDARDFLALDSPRTGNAAISGLRVFLEEGREAGPVKQAIGAAIAGAEIPFIKVQTWQEEKKRILRAVRMEKSLVGFILGVIIIFVGLMIFIIMTVQIVEKTRDLGILQAIGMSSTGVVGIYLRMGGVICLAGIALGVLYGVGFCLSLDVIQRWIYLFTGKEVFPRSVYYIENIPVRLVLSDFLFVIGPTVLFSFLASLLAALRVSRADPLDSLRYE